MTKKDNEFHEGHGGETHQTAHVRQAVLTTNQGVAIADDQNQLKIGPRGPVLLEDMILREKINHFDHERIPERIVHARGSAAHGYFELYDSLSDLTRADLFQRPGEKTSVFVRFSTVAGGAGSVDTPRDVRGFAVKFYTNETVGGGLNGQAHEGIGNQCDSLHCPSGPRGSAEDSVR